MMGNRGMIYKSWRLVITDFEFVYHLLYLSLCILGLCVHEFFYSLLVSTGRWNIIILQWNFSWSDWLTHYQTTNFRLFQTERVCRRQFQIWRKWKKVIQMGRKHCGKRRNLLVTSNFSFSHSVFKRLVSQGRQKLSLCANELMCWEHISCSLAKST